MLKTHTENREVTVYALTAMSGDRRGFGTQWHLGFRRIQSEFGLELVKQTRSIADCHGFM
jgi:hypothetical protein